MRPAQGGAPDQLGKGGSRWGGGAGPPGVPGGQGGRHTVQFQGAGYQSNGLGAERSGRYQEGGSGLLSPNGLKNGRN